MSKQVNPRPANAEEARALYSIIAAEYLDAPTTTNFAILAQAALWLNEEAVKQAAHRAKVAAEVAHNERIQKALGNRRCRRRKGDDA